MLKLESVAAFVAVAEAGSISAAAQRVGKAKSVVSERLADLERTLGTRLVQRSTRSLTLTEDGHSFLERAHRILQEAADAVAEMAQRRGALAGPMRLSAPVGFGVMHLGPALARFLAAHPAIDLTLELDDRFVDAAAGGFDAVLRHGAVADSRLVARRLARSRRLLVASPDYLDRQGVPESLVALVGHAGILYGNHAGDWRFGTGEGSAVVRPRSALRVNNGIVMRDAAVAGLGIAMLPSFFVHEALAAGSLVALEVGAEPEGAELYIAYSRDRSASAKIAALVDSLRRSFGDPPYWDR